MIVSLETIILSSIFVFLMFINPFVTSITFIIFITVGTIYISYFKNYIKDDGEDTDKIWKKKEKNFCRKDLGAGKGH